MIEARRRLAVVGFALAAACGGAPRPEPAAKEPPAAEPATSSGPADAAALPGGERGSLYDLPVRLTDHAGRQVPIDVFRGRTTIVSMFYSSCPAACPTLIADIKKIDARLSPEERDRVRILLVSMDPAKDSPESFRTLADLHGLDLARWTLGLARESDVRMVAAALNIKYRLLPDGNISHSTVITLLRDDGSIDLQVEGLGRGNDDVVARLKQLATP